MNLKTFDELQKLVIKSDIPKLALFLFMNEIPSTTVTFNDKAVIKMKVGIRNGKPSFSLEMYAKSEYDSDSEVEADEDEEGGEE